MLSKFRSRAVARPVWLVAGGHLAILVVVAGRYGYHRDELYFLEAAQHLALGYVDQPPLTPLLARLQIALFGESVTAIRLMPAAVSAGSVVLTALLAREFGGERRAQVVAAAAVAGAGFVLTIGHLLSTATVDFALWMAGLVIAARMLRTGDARWWPAFGAVAGVALWNKQLIAMLAVALVAGLLAERRWELLAPRWLAAGAALAIVIALPTLLWQAANGWPQLEMAEALSRRLGSENRITLIPLQALLLGPLLLPFGVAGARWLWNHDGAAGRFRPLLWAYLIALLLTLLSGGRPYYPLPLAAAIVAAGAVALQQVPRWRVTSLLIANAATSLPIALPLLPAGVLAQTPISEINDTLVETIGWPELVDEVAAVVSMLPAAERDEVVLITGSYGEAGALDRYGPRAGLPQPYSGHNSYWHWRRPDNDGANVVAVRMSRAFLEQHFDVCTLAARLDNELGIDNEAQGQAIWTCQGMHGTWAERWPAFRHYD